MILIGDKYFQIQPIKMKYYKLGFFELFKSIEKYTLTELYHTRDGKALLELILNYLFDYKENIVSYIVETINDYTFEQFKELVLLINKSCIDEEINRQSSKNKDVDSKTDQGLNITIKRLYTILGTHCGLSEAQLDECTYEYVNDCMSELMLKLQYESHLYLLSNSNYENKEVGTYIDELNPFNYDFDKKSSHKKFTTKDMQALGIPIKKLENVELIKDIKLKTNNIQKEIEKDGKKN